MRYSEEQLWDYEADRLEWLDRADKLRDTVLLRLFRSPRAEEIARTGFVRRIGYLEHALVRLSEFYPPNLTSASRDIVRDAGLLLQAFVMNVFGAIDNLAFIWALERNVTAPDGRQLSKQETVFIGTRGKQIRESLTPLVRSAIDNASEWFKLVGAYRHGVAHQIPIYIPRLLTKKDQQEAESLDLSLKAAFADGDRSKWDDLFDKRHRLGDFGGLMALDGVEKPLMLHPQVVCDLATVVELGEVIFKELHASRN